MTKQKVLLLGATGQTGGSVLNGLLEHGNYEVEALVRPASAEKPEVAKLKERGIKIRIGDTSGPVDELVKVVQGFDTVISTVSATEQLAQISLVTAAQQAGVKRFVPCAFISVVPPTGVMTLRDQKEEVYNHIKRLKLPYTIIDVGYWHQISFPSLPSKRVDYALVRKINVTIHGDGETPNLLGDLRDIGRFVARIIEDERTLNKYVVTYSESLSENEIFSLIEELSGEKIARQYITGEQIKSQTDEATKRWNAEPENILARLAVISGQYDYSKYIRADNTLENAKYLGYLDARELYPDLKPILFRDFLKELLDGKIVKPYGDLTL